MLTYDMTCRVYRRSNHAFRKKHREGVAIEFKILKATKKGELRRP
jgi:hypothetical protein